MTVSKTKQLSLSLALSAVAGFFIAVGPSCLPGGCDETNCATGCCSKGVCQMGNEQFLCGTSGFSCERCSDIQKCQEGSDGGTVTRTCVNDPDKLAKPPAVDSGTPATDSGTPATDGGMKTDGGMSSDAGPSTDGGSTGDAGTPATDGGAAMDAGMAPDGGSTEDAGSTPGAGDGG
jgi:hypothetical protein